MSKNIQTQQNNLLWSRNFILACFAYFLMGAAFYLLMPTLPFYLSESFGANKHQIGIILSFYTIAALAIRPFSGFIVDSFKRKPIYLLSYLFFVLLFGGYLLAGSLLFITILRFWHGLTWGVVTTAGNTIALDIMPSRQRGKGLGYYGVFINMSMAIGPIIGLFIYDHFPIQWMFYAAFLCGLLGLALASIIHIPQNIPTHREPLSFDRFVLIKAIPIGVNLFLITLSYGAISTFAAMYGKESGIANTGMFFTLFAVGVAGSRLYAGSLIDRGKIGLVGLIGIGLLTISFPLLSLIKTQWIYFGSALFIGTGFGTIIPCFQNLTISLAPSNRRGTANSTYLTASDVGVGMGVLLAGQISELTSLSQTFLLCSVSNLTALIMYYFFTIAYYQKNKLTEE